VLEGNKDIEMGYQVLNEEAEQITKQYKLPVILAKKSSRIKKDGRTIQEKAEGKKVAMNQTEYYAYSKVEPFEQGEEQGCVEEPDKIY
jgi:hypothetical protein